MITPWQKRLYDDGTMTILDANGRAVCDEWMGDEDDLDHIVACVNACAGPRPVPAKLGGEACTVRVRYHVDGQEPCVTTLDALLRKLLADGVSVPLVDQINAEVDLLGVSRGTHELGNFAVCRAPEEVHGK